MVIPSCSPLRRTASCKESHSEIARFARLQVGFGHVLIARQIPGLAKVINRCWRFIMLPPVLRRFFP